MIKNKEDLFCLKAKEIAKKYNVDISTVYKARRNFNKPRKKGKVNHTFASDFLSEIDTEEKAYILGLLISDGTIKKYVIVLTLNTKDKEILEKIHDILQLNNPVIDRTFQIKGKISYNSTLTIYSKLLCEKMSKWGLIPNKTHFAYFPNIPKELYSHFIRGVFDGDGCIHVDKAGNLHIKIVGNKTLIEKIQEIIVEECNISSTKIMHCSNSKSNIVALQHGGNKKCSKIFEYIYRNATLYMKRKNLIYEQFKTKTK